MRSFLFVLLAALLVAPLGSAQMEFQQGYQVRGAVGDIPSTPAVEKVGAWNVEQRLTVTHTNGTAQDLHFNLPSSATLDSVGCTCPHVSSQAQASGLVVSVAPNNPSGATTVRVVSTQPFSTSLGFSLRAPTEAGADVAVILYVPFGMALEAPTQPGTSLPSTDGSSTIQAFTFDAGSPLPQPFWAAIHPGTSGTTTTTPSSTGIPWLFVGAGVLVGAIAWAVLVQRGVVQKRGRKQVAQVAAHTEIAASDPPAVLEGKKRALLAALKEVELAKQAQQMDTATYDAVKAEFKKQAVTVMRALDEGEAKKA